ncbi:SGNH/GDSL hydrolase family protein [Prosthecomicrobium pneumaticum]|uniref:Lysophospholipase L1-like esterase n=1 Tax=Prosthecomicrobium pneumaticum TaxID=81895 RepID=A0A7W9FPP0_9HYPH|nr:SGNH/GDSL hydrolase family protein [Prosthecomicrobium pneumaticum]MBB5754529.1 lysophospholipase L1-like esterase [Prosthecomicrobium pneumaticum]
MKTIVCYGDSNTWGAEPQPFRGAGGRFGPSVRWPGVLRARLGEGFAVIEEGLNGRTTCVDDPVEGAHKNGARFLPVCLETHMPLDLLIVKLGTNDLKARLSMQACDIAAGAGLLADTALRSATGPDGRPPKVLIVAPAPLARLGWLAEMFEGGTAKSHRLAAEMAVVAAERGVAFFDAGTVIASSEGDGIHLDGAAHQTLGEALAETVRSLFAGP